MIDNPKIPRLATGEFDPTLYQHFKDAKDEADRKKQFRHDWMIACFSCVTGAIFGFIASILYNVIF